MYKYSQAFMQGLRMVLEALDEVMMNISTLLGFCLRSMAL